ncbi:MAG: EamA family transporter [Nitriliruptor sp.]|nr:MAG: EamA family transporter [Nitriliruptor sp.]
MSAPDLSLSAPFQRLPLVGQRIGDVVVARRVAMISCALGIVYLVWGSTYLAIAVVVAEVPPMLMLAVRFLLAGGVLFVVAVRRGDRAGDPIRPRHLLQAVVTGGLLLVGGTGMIALAQTRISSGLAALLAATVPLFLALFARGLFGDRLSARAWLGLLVGLVGIAVLVDPAGGELGAVLLALFGAAAWAAGSLRSRMAKGPRRPLVAASLEMLGGALVFAVVGLLLGEASGWTLSGVSARAWGAFAYLVVAGSLVAYTAYSWLLRNASTTLVGTYAYVNPVVAVGLGALVLGETVEARTALAGALVLGSVVLLITGRPGEPVPAQPTSGADVFAGNRRWARLQRRIGSLPRAARLYRDPGALPYRSTGYDPLDALDDVPVPEPAPDTEELRG